MNQEKKNHIYFIGKIGGKIEKKKKKLKVCPKKSFGGKNGSPLPLDPS